MENYFGRFLTASEIDKSTNLDNFEKLAAMTSISSRKIRCNRCYSVHDNVEVELPISSYYCPSCINLGRVRSDEDLFWLPQQAFKPQDVLRWSGQLTSRQKKISDELITATQKHEKILVHAVTGAGKTEMIYGAIDACLKIGGVVCIASPRIDVCIELHKRLTRDFDLPISLLHGGGEPYSRTALIIATTHQLLRFKEAFDLLIVDEVDAFPFVDNAMLYHAVAQSQKPNSTLLYLTATSTDNLDKQVASSQLKKLHLARRFHNNPLVVPQFLWYKKFHSVFKKQRQTAFPLLIFAPEIDQGETFAQQLQNDFPEEKIGFVASTTANRLEIVEKFRKNEFTILVTTTILERGVTFPMVDVFVVDSQHFNFTKSALIQIAGRVGRSPDRPSGLVYFFHNGRTKAMLKARAEIRSMNQKGGFT